MICINWTVNQCKVGVFSVTFNVLSSGLLILKAPADDFESWFHSSCRNSVSEHVIIFKTEMIELLVCFLPIYLSSKTSKNYASKSSILWEQLYHMRWVQGSQSASSKVICLIALIQPLVWRALIATQVLFSPGSRWAKRYNRLTKYPDTWWDLNN